MQSFFELKYGNTKIQNTEIHSPAWPLRCQAPIREWSLVTDKANAAALTEKELLLVLKINFAQH